MFETKSELRKIATAALATAAAISTITLSACSPAAPSAENQKTIAFIQSKFIDSNYVEGFTPGVADYGITLEMLLQLKALGETPKRIEKAVKHVLETEDVSGSVEYQSGYLFQETKAQLGLVGKYAFTSVAVGAKNQAARNELLNQAYTDQIAGLAGGVILPRLDENPFTDFALAWFELGLIANHHTNQAQVAANALIQNQNLDGGFDDYEIGTSTVDATGLAMLALAAVEKTANEKFKPTVTSAIEKAAAYLDSTIATDKAHWESYGFANVNGTALAYMGLKATDKTGTDAISAWLKKQITADGGVQAGFAPGLGDAMATSQAAAAIQGMTYLDLIK